MQSAVQIEVYPTDADAADAAATLIAERVRAATGGRRATVAVGAGRSGRATMVALAARGDLPWASVEWFLADERVGPANDPLAHATVARDSLFGPRGVTAARIHRPELGADAGEIAARYASLLAERLGPDGVLDVVALGLGADGALGALAPVSAALDASTWVAAVPPSAADEPARVSITPALLGRAGHVIVTAVGPDTAAVVASALREGRGPAARVLPSARVTWVVDRGAAETLLKGASPVEGPAR
jgi:6-phosphogluconolactonase/glucosamine-6-phosphate isomerase/deaminase